MADIKLTEGDDVYVQPESEKNNWDNIFGLGGNDTIKIFGGTVIGGPGNDIIEKIPTPGEPWRTVGVAYWGSPTGVRVDLQGGWAEDGYGGRDTLIGVDVVHGAGDDWFNGNSNDNYFWGNGGNDTVNGGAGIDTVGVNDNFRSADGSRRFPRLDELDIWVSADGRTATIKPKIGAGTGFSYTLTDVELFQLFPGGYSAASTTYTLSDFITLQAMAEQAIAAGPSLRWNAAQPLGSLTTVSFSFVNAAPASGVGAPGFRAFTATEQQLVRDILAKTSALAGINFSEVADNGANFGQIRFGVSQQTATKGVSWLPNQTAAGDLAGDVWMDLESMTGIATGTEGYAALLHEIGHALGLRHPRNVDAGDSWATQLRTADDRTALSVMASVSSADGLFRADWGPLDAGTDTLDASAYSTGVNLNLIPGGLSNVGLSVAGLAGVENLSIGAGTWIENAMGSRFDDVLIGNDLNNRLTGNLGNDWIEGGKGVDTAVFAGNLADYILSYDFGKNFVQARDGVSGFDTLIGVERLQFADKTVNLTVQAKAAAAPQADVQRLAELYVAFFNRVPDADGLEYWIGQMGAGQSINQIAQSFYNAGIQYSSLTGFSAGMSHDDFVNVVYKNVLGRSDGADPGGLAYWSGKLADGSASRGSLVSTILDSAHTFKGDGTYGWVANLLDNKIAVARTFAIDLGLNYNTAAESISQGMAIAAAVTSTSTAAAITLIGVTGSELQLG